MVNECRHIMPSGLNCHSPAMRGSSYCYFHARPQRPARPREARIEMPDRLDRKGTQIALHRIMQALANGHISARRAAVLLYGIQMSLSQPPQNSILQPKSGSRVLEPIARHPNFVQSS